MKLTDFEYNWVKISPDKSRVIAAFGTDQINDTPPADDKNGKWVPSGWFPPKDHPRY